MNELPDNIENYQQNKLHGKLLQILQFLKIGVNTSKIEEFSQKWINILNKKISIGSSKNKCHLTRATFYEIIMIIYSYLKEIKNEEFLNTIIRECKEAILLPPEKVIIAFILISIRAVKLDLKF